MKDLRKLFQANPARGVVVHGSLPHWHELLEEWCMVHERYCRLAENDAIFWHPERSNLAALAGAAWRCGWAALEEFPHDKMANRSKFSGRADLYLMSPGPEYFVEAKLVWCQDRNKPRHGRVLLNGINIACKDARALRLGNGTGINRISVVFAVASLSKTEQRDLPGVFATLFETVHGLGLDAAAWCFPRIAKPLECEGEERVFPGVFLLAKKA